MKITEENVKNYAFEQKIFNFQQISDKFGCGRAMDKKPRYLLQQFLFKLCDDELLKYSTISHRYFTIGEWRKVKGKK